MKKRILSILLSVCILISILPISVFANQSAECDHVHDELCGYIEQTEEIVCDQECQPDEDGITIHAEDCAYTPATAGAPCTHQHDENCGYTEPDNEEAVCSCETKCTAEEKTEECDVCGAEDANLALCIGAQAQTEEIVLLEEPADELPDSFEADTKVFYSTYVNKTFTGILVETSDMPNSADAYGVEIEGQPYPYTSAYNNGVYIVDIAELDASEEYQVKPYYTADGMNVYSDSVTLTTAAARTKVSGYSHYSYEGDHVAVGYGTKAAGNGGAVDFIGHNGTTWLQSTYNSAGWAYIFEDDPSNSSSWVETNGPKVMVYQSEKIQAWVVPETSADGNFGILTYYIRNLSGEKITNYKFGAAADIKIGSRDSAPIAKTDYGISMTDGENTFALIGKEGYSGISTSVSTIWFGDYRNARSNVYTSASSDSLTGTDSGASYSWQNITLEPGEIKEFKLCLGIGDTEKLESLLKPDASINYADETLTGLTPDSIYRITVGTDEFTVTAGSDGTVSIIGTDKNGREYNLIGKTIKISEIKEIEGSLQVGEAQNVTVAARPDAVVPDYNAPDDATPELPDDLDITTTENSVTIRAQAGQEYSIDGGQTWKTADSSGNVVFSGLSDDTIYSVLTRVAATDSNFASEKVVFSIRTSKMLTITDVTVSENVHVYDGTAKSLVISSDGATASYSASLGGTYSSTLPKYTDVGEYTVFYKIEKSGYHDYYNFATIEISEKEIVIDWSNTSFIYDGTAKLPIATAVNVVTGDDISLTVEGAKTNASGTAYTATVTAITGADAGNYKLPPNVTTQFTIGKATPDIGTVSVSGTVKDTTVAAEVVLTHTGKTAGTFAITDSAMLANKPEYNWKFTPTDITNYTTATGTVVIDVLDTAAPTATITVADNQWKTALNNITFGLFFKDKQTVTITPADNEHGSGIKTVEYYVANAAVTDFTAVDWTEYNGAFSINPNSKYVIYAKVTDKDGNSITVNSDGMVVDATKPAVENITNDGVYYGDLEITVTDALAGVKELKVDGTPVTMTYGKYTITADNTQHTVLVTDNAGNEMSYVITVYKNYTVTYKADGNVVTTKSAGHGLKPDLTVEIPYKEGYDETAPYWEIDGEKITEETVITQDTTITAVYAKNEPGEYENTTPPTNEGGAKLDNTLEELKQAVEFTDEELWDIDHGKDVKLWLEVTDISDTVPAENRTLVEAKLDGKTLGMYLDIDMFKQIGTERPVAVTQFNRLIKVSLVLDDSLINANSNVSRAYRVIRVHNGVADYIGCEFDAATKKLSFETDRLSTYAVVYNDTVLNTGNSTTQTTTPMASNMSDIGNSTTQTTTKTVSNVPDTGDTIDTVLWLVLEVSSIAVIAVIAKKRKEME